MAELRCPGEPTVKPYEQNKQPSIKITLENLEEALRVLRKVLDEEPQQ